MKATDIKNGLEERYSPSEFVHIHEAPDSASRLGRKLDVLVLSTWASRGFEVDGFEIKVSRSDWLKELSQAEKADFWWTHCNRFWLCVPAPADKLVKDGELPTTWGLMEFADGGGSKIVQKAPRHDAKPIPWDTVIGCFRAMQGTGLNVVHRARQGGYDDGYKRGVADTKRETDNSAFERLRRDVEAFEAAAGFKITGRFAKAADIGKAVERLLSWESPEKTMESVRRQVQCMHGLADKLAELADELEPAITRKPATADEPGL